MHVDLIPAFSDNYIYAIRDGASCWIVDPGDATPVLDYLDAQGAKLEGILITHHHADHIAGVSLLKERFGCGVMGPSTIKEVERALSDGDTVHEGALSFQVLAVPGHTLDHLAFYFPKQNWVFTGDSLFAGGCGRLFEGSPEQMHHSLQRLKALPDETEVFCGHEYTLANLDFAVTVDPDNPALKKRVTETKALREQGKPTIPSTIAVEKASNPFVRAGDVDTFAAIRKKKDNF